MRPGKDDRKPLCTASRRVDGTGDPRDAWWNVARSFLVVSERTMALQVAGFGVGRSSSRWTNHILLGPLRWPTMMTVPALFLMTSSF